MTVKGLVVLLDSYNSIHHYVYYDSGGVEHTEEEYRRRGFLDWQREPIDDEYAFMGDLGSKRIVSVDDFVMEMLKTLTGFKYLYESTIEACVLCTSYQKRIKCAEPPSVVLARCREVLCQFFEINPMTRVAKDNGGI